MTEETAGKRTPGALPSKILPPHLPETEGTGPSSTAVAPLGAGGATSRNLSVTVSFLSSGWSIKEITRSTASHALGCISFRASPHSAASRPCEFLRMGIRLFHHRRQNHALINDRSIMITRPTHPQVSAPLAEPYVLSSLLFTATAPRIIARMAQRRPGTIATHPRHGRKASNARINPTIPRTNARMVETVSGTERRGSE